MEADKLTEHIIEIKETLGGLAANFDTVVKKIECHDGDITALKVWRANLAGRITMITSLVAFGSGLVGAFIKEKFFN